MPSEPIDPVTRAVVQNRLIAIAREMSLTLQRAAYSPIIYEVKDYSSVLLRPNGGVVAQAEGIPSFLGSMHQALPPVLARYPLDEMEPGDVYISNDPYLAQGTHKNDVNVLRPIFWDDAVIFFSVTKAHWTDIGGKDPGSWSPDARNIYEEGVSIPPLRLYRAGVRNEEVLELILANTRLPENNFGDFMAQISAAHTADVRTRELLADYGADVVNACVDSLFDYVEATVRAAIAQIPDGSYTAEDWVDSDGVSEEPVRVRVTVTIAGSDITLDFRDNEPQRGGACGNAPRVCTEAACRASLKYLFGPDTEANDGFYRPMTLLTTPGTVTHAVYPAPMTVWDNMGRAISETVFFALAQVIPERVAAGIFGGVQAMAIAGEQPDTNKPFIHFMPYAGGWGARATKDGISAMCPHLNGDNYNVPCEVIEANYPLRVERYELIQDSGGAGRFRGGLGVRIDYRVLSGPVTVSASMSRYRFAPTGLFDGAEGMRSSLLLNAGTPQEENRPRVGGEIVATGALISHRCGGGGGFGHPAERAQAALARDVSAGYVSAEAAAEVYGGRTDNDDGGT